MTQINDVSTVTVVDAKYYKLNAVAIAAAIDVKSYQINAVGVYLVIDWEELVENPGMYGGMVDMVGGMTG